MRINLKNLFKRNKPVITPEGKLQAAQSKVSEAFIMFQQANDAVVEANQELNEGIAESDKRIASLSNKLNTEEQVKKRQLEEIEMNNKLAEQLEPFIK